MEILVVVDMQNDFVHGSLGTKEAEEMIEQVVEKVKNFKGEIVYTLDTHREDYLNTQEGRHLPIKHCIQGTKGHEIIDELKNLDSFSESFIFEKNTFGSVDLINYLVQRTQEDEVDRIIFVGLCTDICVISNVLMTKAHLTEVPIQVDASCCAGITPEKHNHALDVLASCQVEII
ncbi:MAG: isochorismatase family cysteine hydrolase [Tissierellia bacterium]|nr:isochorismatase family cysteine hydrolase [Tissierellia bacterium]